ncbi:MAG: PDZ domain-containing protein [Pirellulales bacterium]|nr:PDZ domain-containing protein [Pirellulales bacterium]
MLRKIFLNCSAMLLLAGFAWAAEPPPSDALNDQTVPPKAGGQAAQNPPDVLFFKATPGRPIPAPDEQGRTSHRMFNQALIGGPMPAEMQGVAQLLIPGEYWLGIECYSVPPALRAHLSLEDNVGLVVGSVVPDSPAAKAGLETHDVLLQAGETKLSTVQDLSATIEAAKETPLKLEIIHAGKPKTVEISPAKRPQNATTVREGAPGDWQEIEKWMEKMRGGANAERPQQFQFRVIQPGAILPPGAPLQPPMPGNMSINISRNGDQPARITVDWNDKKWEITEKELDKLPAEVRPHVERMLGRGKFEWTTPGGGKLTAEALDFTMPAPPPGMPGAPGPQMQVQPFRSLEDRLEAMSRKIDALQKQLESKRGDDRPPQAEQSAPEENPNPSAPTESNKT